MKNRVSVFIAATVIASTAIGCHVVSADPHIAFLGDSITKAWDYPRINYGVFGNTTSQMLARFPQTIPGHGYHQVVILGGTNDILLNVSPEETIHNLEILGEETVKQHAEPVLCEIPPIFHSYKSNDRKNYRPAVVELNRRITILAAVHHWKLVDYYSPLVNHPTFSADGVHLKRRGYWVMEASLLPMLLK